MTFIFCLYSVYQACDVWSCSGLAGFTVGATPTSRFQAAGRDEGVAPTDGSQHAEQLSTIYTQLANNTKTRFGAIFFHPGK
jgi:hypothetical protein